MIQKSTYCWNLLVLKTNIFLNQITFLKVKRIFAIQTDAGTGSSRRSPRTEWQMGGRRTNPCISKIAMSDT
jgi:hypothetical protein